MYKDEFIETIGELANQINNSLTKHILPSICVAQACLETGYGQSETMMRYNAPFGIKATSSWDGSCYNSTTHEYYDNVKVAEGGCFRAYDSLKSAVADYYNLLTESSYYTGAVNNYDFINAVEHLKAYATDPNYTETLKSIIISNNLTRFDNLGDSGNVTEIALAVFRGEYGDGLERKAVLGGKYEKVQNEVNRLYNLVTQTKNGNFGNGQERKSALGADYSAVQYLINNNLI